MRYRLASLFIAYQVLRAYVHEAGIRIVIKLGKVKNPVPEANKVSSRTMPFGAARRGGRRSSF